MRKILLGALLLVTVGLVLFPNYRWLLVNGVQAQSCAESMLNSSAGNCDWFNHMVVSSDSGMVSFSNHDSAVIYAYSPKWPPLKVKGIAWNHIYSVWYVGVIKT